MSAEKQAKYSEMKASNEELLQKGNGLSNLLTLFQILNRCCYKHSSVFCLQDLVHSQAKQEAVVLHEKLHRNMGSPQEERERLFKQVKENNQEIASMERQLSEVREKISNLTEEMRQLDADMEEHQGERTQKYKELQKREEEIDVYLNTFEENKHQEQQLIRDSQSSVVALLEHSSRNISRLHQLSAVTAQELRSMQDDLSFKETEMQKSHSTARGLSSESERLQQDLLKVEQLESKVSSELQTLRDQLELMKQELHTYRDLEALTAAGEDRKKSQRKDTFRKMIHNMNEEYEGLKNQLQENEMHVELTNMERKWQHLEQNNFVMKEFIASKAVESDYRPVVKTVNKHLQEYNKILVDTLQGTRN
ncbi:hypothetical protein PO909_026606 [Leuciscus waleckii]